MYFFLLNDCNPVMALYSFQIMCIISTRIHDHISIKTAMSKIQSFDNSVALVRERTIPTERPPSVGEVSANFCG